MPSRYSILHRRRRSWVMLAAAVAFAVGAIVFMIVTSSHANRASAATGKQAVALSSTDTTRLEKALSSSDQSVQATALVSEERTTYMSTDAQPLPPGVTVTIDPNTFRRNDSAASVYATDSSKQKWVLHLYLEKGQWLIVYAEGVKP